MDWPRVCEWIRLAGESLSEPERIITWDDMCAFLEIWWNEDPFVRKLFKMTHQECADASKLQDQIADYCMHYCAVNNGHQTATSKFTSVHNHWYQFFMNRVAYKSYPRGVKNQWICTDKTHLQEGIHSQMGLNMFFTTNVVYAGDILETLFGRAAHLGLWNYVDFMTATSAQWRHEPDWMLNTRNRGAIGPIFRDRQTKQCPYYCVKNKVTYQEPIPGEPGRTRTIEKVIHRSLIPAPLDQDDMVHKRQSYYDSWFEQLSQARQNWELSLGGYERYRRDICAMYLEALWVCNPKKFHDIQPEWITRIARSVGENQPCLCHPDYQDARMTAEDALPTEPDEQAKAKQWQAWHVDVQAEKSSIPPPPPEAPAGPSAKKQRTQSENVPPPTVIRLLTPVMSSNPRALLIPNLSLIHI